MSDKKKNLVRLTEQERGLGKLLALSIPRGRNMTDCPSTEQLAEFIDGKHSPDGSTIVITHLAECETCYAIVSDSLTVSEELNRQSRARIKRYIAYAVSSGLAAAAVLFLVFRIWQPAQEFAVKPAQEAAHRAEPVSSNEPQLKSVGTAAPLSFAGDLAARLMRKRGAVPVSLTTEGPSKTGTAFGFSSAVSADKAAFRIGMRLTDFEVVRQARDREKTEAFAEQLIELLKPMESSYGPIPPVMKPKDGGRTDAGDAGRFDGFSNSIEALFANKKESVYLMFGAWVEAARLAAAVNDAAFFKAAEVRAFKNELGNRSEPIGTLKDLSQLDTIISSGQIQPDQFKTIARLLTDIKAMY